MVAATSRWRAPEDATGALIGPNAILQLVPVIDRVGGPNLLARILAGAGVAELPDGQAMIPEGPVARVHRELRRVLPDQAPSLAREAGRRTADYILANRIPGPAQTVLRHLPPAPAAWALSHAIAKHAWTFVGSGRFQRVSSLRLEIEDNPVVRGESSGRPLCDWHAGVFERLYGELVDPGMVCVETDCAAVSGRVCRFHLKRND